MNFLYLVRSLVSTNPINFWWRSWTLTLWSRSGDVSNPTFLRPHNPLPAQITTWCWSRGCWAAVSWEPGAPRAISTSGPHSQRGEQIKMQDEMTIKCCFRYKVFIDLFNMSTFLIPRHLIPPLTPQVKSSGSNLIKLRLFCFNQMRSTLRTHLVSESR